MALSFVISAYINDHNVCTHYVLTYIPTYLIISNCSVVLVYFCSYIVISKEKTTVDNLPAQLKFSEQDFRLVDGWLCIVSLSYVTQLPIICAYSTMEFWSCAIYIVRKCFMIFLLVDVRRGFGHTFLFLILVQVWVLRRLIYLFFAW